MQPTRPAPPDEAARYVREGYWRQVSLDTYLDRCVREYPDAVAVVDRDRRLTFAEVDEQARRFATALAARGVGPGDVVTLQLPNWLEATVAFQAIIRLRAVANPVMPIYRGRELRFILRQSQAKAAVIPATFRGFDFPELYGRLLPELPHLHDVIVVGGDAPDNMRSWARCLEQEPMDVPAGPADPDAVALLLYTSGTTADPKGALHSHNTLGFDVHSIADWFRLNERDVIFNPSPVTHITGVLCALMMPFVVGCRAVLQDVWDPDEAVALIARETCSFMLFATPFLQGLTYSPEREHHDLSSIRYICCGGADIPADLLRVASQRLGTVVRMYGATEGPSTHCTNLDDPPEKRAQTDGRWMLPTEGRLIDDSGGSVDPGQVGEVLWRGPDMFLGYLDASLNEEAFTDDGYFRSGDLAVMDTDGYLTVHGRKKDIIIRGGENISIREVENLIYAHPAVREVAVVAMPDEAMGEKGCAYVVLEPRHALTLDELVQYLTDQEIAKQKLPERLEIVDELPKTPSGKIQKFVLRDRIRRQVEEESAVV